MCQSRLFPEAVVGQVIGARFGSALRAGQTHRAQDGRDNTQGLNPIGLEGTANG